VNVWHSISDYKEEKEEEEEDQSLRQPWV